MTLAEQALAEQALAEQALAEQALAEQALAEQALAEQGLVTRAGAAAAALISVCLGFFVIQLDVTIVNVALPAIQRGIGGSLAGLQWVIDAYTLALASIMLTDGSAADRAGARKVFVLGLSAFAVGSAACAAAPALGVLIAARAVQGLGASALLPCSLALLVHQFPDPRARARALGVWGGMGSLGVALGPVLGGALVAAVGWRSIFGVNVPVCLLTVTMLRRYVDESPKNPGRRTDVPGLLLGVTALSALTAGFITAGQQGWLTPLPGALLAVGLIAALSSCAPNTASPTRSSRCHCSGPGTSAAPPPSG